MRWPLIPDEFPKLEGDRLELRALGDEDLSAWFARLADNEAAALAGDPVATSIDDTRRSLRYHQRAFRAKEGIRWAIVPQGRSASVGTIGLADFGVDTRSAALGGAIGRADWSRGIATRATVRVLRYAFDDLRLDIVWAVVLPENARVQRVLAKTGFQSGCPVTGIDRSVGTRTDTLAFHARRA